MKEDLISRQAAIDVLDALDITDGVGISSIACNLQEEAIRGIQKLPSAQPEIIRCKDCVNWDTTWQIDWAKNYHYCPIADGVRNGDWYCADAERRTDV